MRRDYVTLNVRHVARDGDRLPTAELVVDEPADQLGDRLVAADGDRLGADAVDVAFRLQSPLDEADGSGVFSLSNRVTGEFVLEVNADTGAVLDLVDTARNADDRDGDDASYRVVVRRDDDAIATYGKRTLLVYDEDGNLLRQHSLIPSGVEL